jgi:predicted ATP-binding protein involved in virulence
MTIRESKTIKSLANKAIKGDLSAKFLLSQYYLNGQFVEQDINIAKEYFEEIIKHSRDFNFRFKELKLINFRRFEELSLKMPAGNLAVLIGDNGTGKTSILEAISKSLSWFVNNFLREETTGQKLSSNDICNSNMSPFASVKSVFQFYPKNECYVELSKPRDSSESGVTGDYAQIKLIADLYRHLNSSITNFNLPILAYYPIERTQNVVQIHSSKIEKISNENWNSSDGYDLSLTANQNFNRFLGWYKKLSNINLSTNSELNNIQSQIDSNKKLLILVAEQIKTAPKTVEHSLLDLKTKLEIEIIHLQKRLYSEQSPTNKNLTLINNAITTFMTELKNIRHENFPEDGFFVFKNDVKLEAKQLSQGERTLIALIGDIARRLIFLNPSLENPLHGSGVVLIDEIELHIHPALQQAILPNLASTFPNIQFIVTTHSPQVLSTSDVSAIRVLSEDENSKPSIHIPIFQTKGVTSADILANIMGTPPIPKIYESELLENYINYIENNNNELDTNTPEYKELLEIFGASHPVMVNIERIKRLNKLKRKADLMIKKKGV